MGGGGCLPAGSLVVGTGARLAVVRATSARVSKVSGAAFVTARSLRVVLAALQQKEQRIDPRDQGRQDESMTQEQQWRKKKKNRIPDYRRS